MEQLKTYEIGVGPSDLKKALDGEMPEGLLRPLQALAADIAARANREPASIYLCAADDDRETRDYFGAVLARTLQHKLPDTLLVDCDFLAPGLSGLVPQHDALGFLDMLLYGSSLGAIKQPSPGGFSVVGAGSFPVTRKSAFAMDVFVSAARYLASHSKCVIYCGPVLDDEQEVHPILAQVDLPVLLRVGAAGGQDSVEEKVARAGQETMWCVRLVAGARTPEPPAEPAPPVKPERPEPELDDTIVLTPADEIERDQPVYDQAPVYEVPAPGKRTGSPASPSPRAATAQDVPPAPRGGGSSTFPKVVATVLLILIPAFFLWWLHLTRSVREQNGDQQEMVAAPPPASQGQPPAVVRDTAATAVRASAENASGQTTAGKPAGTTQPPKTPKTETEPPKTRVEPRKTKTAPPKKKPEPVVSAADNLESSILVTDNIREFSGKFMVHVSSFRQLDHARRDGYYLNDRGYPIVIAKVDLGAKGKWYRVYVGPCDARDEARNLKIRLDEIPRVKFTRITRVEE